MELKNVYIFAFSNFNWAWLPLAKKIREEHQSKIHFICINQVECDTWKAQDKENIVSRYINAGALVDEYGKNNEAFEIAMKRAQSYEEKYNTLLSDALQADRHLGRGYASGGPGYARSKLSAKAKYLDSINFFNKHINYWEKQFELEPPNLLIGIASGLPGKTCNVVARKLGAQTRGLIASKYKNNFIWTTNEFYHCPQIIDAFKKNEATYSNWATEEEVTKIKRLTWSAKNYKVWMKKGQRITLIKDCLKCFRRFFYKKLKQQKVMGDYYLLEQFREIYQEHKAIRYMNRQTYIDISEAEKNPFVFYPLSVEPESALHFNSPEFNEQLSIIEMVAKNLPAGVRLIVKDHIGGMSKRPKDFFETLRTIPAVHIASPTSLATDFIRKAKAVIVITSTAGTEASYMGVPVLSYSIHNAFNILPYVHLIRDIFNLRPLLRDLCLRQESVEDVNKRKVLGLRYLAAIKQASFDMEFSNYASKKREHATSQELEILYSNLVKSLGFDGNLFFKSILENQDSEQTIVQ